MDDNTNKTLNSGIPPLREVPKVRQVKKIETPPIVNPQQVNVSQINKPPSPFPSMKMPQKQGQAETVSPFPNMASLPKLTPPAAKPVTFPKREEIKQPIPKIDMETLEEPYQMRDEQFFSEKSFDSSRDFTLSEPDEIAPNDNEQSYDGYRQNDRKNERGKLSLLTFILSFFVSFGAVILGVFSLRYNTKHNMKGNVITWAGIIIGTFNGLFLYFILYVLLSSASFTPA